MRKIIHVDMDAFYASVEMRDNPAYRNVPLAVGGEGPRSVLCTCNYLARQFGVRSAMPAIRAKQLCPDLLIVHGRMLVYKEVSAKIREIFLRYTKLIEPLSLDEAYLDVTDCKLHNGSATLIAQDIRQAIFNELSLTASAGIAPNKFLAKIASDENKPNGQCVISPDKVADFVEYLPLKKIPGVGPKTAEKLAKHGFVTCADIRGADADTLVPIVGKFAHRLYSYGFGQDERDVVCTRVRKSVGVERTFAQDLMSEQECLAVFDNLYEKLQFRLNGHDDRVIVKQGVKLKFADFSQTTVEQQSSSPNVEDYKALIATAYERGAGKGVRLVGLTVGFKSEAKSSSNTNASISLPTTSVKPHHFALAKPLEVKEEANNTGCQLELSL